MGLSYEDSFYGSSGNITPEQWSSQNTSIPSYSDDDDYSPAPAPKPAPSPSKASTSYGGYTNPDDYAAAIKRVIASGGQFQRPEEAGAFMGANPQYGWSSGSGSVNTAVNQTPLTAVQPVIAPVKYDVNFGYQPKTPTPNSSTSSTAYGGYKTADEYAAAIKRVIASGGTFQRPEEAGAFMAKNPQYGWGNGSSPTKSYLPVPPTQPVAQPVAQPTPAPNQPRTVQVGADGKAPPGLNVGDTVKTAGGDYRIIGVNPDGTYRSEIVQPAAQPVQLPQQPTQPVATAPPTDSPTTTNNQQSATFPYEQMLKDLLSRFSQYKTPTDQDILTRAQQAAQLQTNPVLADIVNRLNSAKTTATNQKTETEAAYSGVAQQTQNRLAEARKAALESAISRNMGRSGVVESLTGQLTTPIMLQEQQLGQEKAAKLSAIANELANTEAELGGLRTQTEQQRGLIESQQVSALRDQIQQWIANQQAQEWGRAIDLSKLGIGWQDMLNSQVPTYQW